MPVRDTSREAYATVDKSTQAGKVYEAIALNPGKTRLEISKLIRLPINCVCGRVNELIKRGSVVEGDRKPSIVKGKQTSAYTLYASTENAA